MNDLFKPMGIGELLDRSVRLWSQNWLPLFKVTATVDLSVYVLFQIANLALMGSSHDGSSARLSAEPGAMFIYAAYALTLATVSWVIYVPITAYYLERATVGRIRSPFSEFWSRPSLGRGFKGFVVVALIFLVHCLVRLPLAGGMLALGISLAEKTVATTASASRSIVIGVMVGLGSLLFVLLFFEAMVRVFVNAMLMPSILAVENIKAREAYRRSKKLVRTRVGYGLWGSGFLRASLISLVMTTIFLVLTTATSIPQYIAYYVTGALSTKAVSAGATVLLIAVEVVQLVALAAIKPLSIAPACFLYLDTRSRSEGLDLRLRIDELKARVEKAA